MAYRLHLIGYKKIESDTETPADYSTVKDDDPYPIIVFGLNKPVSSNKIGRYLNSEFYHYLKIYKNIKNYGLPYDNWLNAPKWILDLIDKFDSVTEEYNRYKLSKGII